MPWTPEEFRRKHNKKLTLVQAGKAASIAEAMIRSGVSEGEAIATANRRMMSPGAKGRREMERIARRRRKAGL